MSLDSSTTSLLVWGIFPRLLGLVYLIAFIPLLSQVVPIAGARGITPVNQVLARARRDLPLHRRLLHFPTLLWVRSSDRSLKTLVLVGIVSAALAIVGGPIGYVALLVCWLCYLSLDLAIDLIYPWDCLLFEAGLLALLLPVVEPLPALTATAQPLPVVALAYQVLLVRVLWGFGKFKFNGMTRKDFGYLREFLIAQPVPTKLGWRAHHLPLSVQRAALLLLFLVEVPLPILAFVPGPFRLVLVAAATALMLGIQLTGNFGFFNVLLIALLVPLLDIGSAFSIAISSPQDLVIHALVLVWIVGGVLSFPFNSWVAHAWLYWPAHLNIPSAALRGLLSFYRAISSFRVLHGYGVFGPQAYPTVKLVPVLEGSADGKTWHEYEYRFMPSTETSPPRAFAPNHPRWDHMLLYEGCGMNPAGFLSSVHGSFNPYAFAHVSPVRRMMLRLMEPDAPVRSLFRHDPFAGQKPPRFMRATLFALEPTAPEEQRATGRWWRRHRVGVHLPAIQANAPLFDEWPSGPELFHWDDVLWRRRIGWMQRFETEARSAPDLAAVEGQVARHLDLAPGTVASFWERFVPSVQPTCTTDWCELPTRADVAVRRFGAPALRDYERIASLLAIGLAARLEARVFGKPADYLPLPSYFHIGMLMYRLILAGRATFAQAWSDEEMIEAEARALTPALGAWLWGIFRFDIVAGHCRSFHLVRPFTTFDWKPGLPGFSLLGEFLADQQLDGLPRAHLEVSRALDSGAWRIHIQEAPDADPVAEEVLAA